MFASHSCTRCSKLGQLDEIEERRPERLYIDQRNPACLEAIHEVSKEIVGTSNEFHKHYPDFDKLED